MRGSRMSKSLVEGIDYYYEGRFLVFTEKFLRDRGYCCESGCRHCPWGYRRDARGDLPEETGTIPEE